MVSRDRIFQALTPLFRTASYEKLDESLGSRLGLHYIDFALSWPAHLHVVEDEEESLDGESLEELKGVEVWRRVLMVIVVGGVGCPLEVGSISSVCVCVCERVEYVCVCV